MFNFFKKKDPVTKVIDKVLMSEESKFESLYREWQSDPAAVLVFWFEETLDAAAAYFAGKGANKPTMIMTREANTQQLLGKKIFFAEHYPLHSKEQLLFEKLHLGTVTVYSSLTEPLFKEFGSDRIIQMMKQLGMKEDEVVEHKMITSSIRNAQEKIEKKMGSEFNASSQADWLKKNFTAG